MSKRKTIGVVAHDNRKKDMVEWVEWNWEELVQNDLICTGTTGGLIEAALKKKIQENGGKLTQLNITKLKSGPLGGDQQLGAQISEGKIDMLFFLWDPMQPQPHDVDVKALLRISVMYNIPIAMNRSTADYIISSELMKEEYHPIIKDYSEYIKREL